MTTTKSGSWARNLAPLCIVERERKRRKPASVTLATRKDVGRSRRPNHNTPDTLPLTEPTPRPMLGISALLQLLTCFEHTRAVQASEHEDGGVPCPIPHPTRI